MSQAKPIGTDRRFDSEWASIQAYLLREWNAGKGLNYSGQRRRL